MLRSLLVASLLAASLWPASSEAKKPKHGVYVFKSGTLVGIALRLKAPHRLVFMLNAAHRIQWIRCRLPKATLQLFVQGSFRIEELKAGSSLKIKYDSKGRLASLNGRKITYDRNGRLAAVGKMKLSYDVNGRLNKVGSIAITHRFDHRIGQLGSIKLEYYSEGRIKSLGGIPFRYQSDGRVRSIGKLRFTYQSMQNTLESSAGSSKLDVRFIWSLFDIYRILQKPLKK